MKTEEEIAETFKNPEYWWLSHSPQERLAKIWKIHPNRVNTWAIEQLEKARRDILTRWRTGRSGPDDPGDLPAWNAPLGDILRWTRITRGLPIWRVALSFRIPPKRWKRWEARSVKDEDIRPQALLKLLRDFIELGKLPAPKAARIATTAPRDRSKRDLRLTRKRVGSILFREWQHIAPSERRSRRVRQPSAESSSGSSAMDGQPSPATSSPESPTTSLPSSEPSTRTSASPTSLGSGTPD